MDINFENFHYFRKNASPCQILIQKNKLITFKNNIHIIIKLLTHESTFISPDCFLRNEIKVFLTFLPIGLICDHVYMRGRYNGWFPFGIFVHAGRKKYTNNVKRMRSEEKFNAQEHRKWCGQIEKFQLFFVCLRTRKKN